MNNREKLGTAVGDAVTVSGRPFALHRHMLPAHVGLLLVALAALLTAGCAYKATVPPSEGHIAADQFPSKGLDERVLPPVTTGDFVPPPRPQVKQPTYSVVVHEVPVKELLFALSRDTRQNIDVHPGVQGLVTLNAIDETLPAILERLSQQVNMRYRTEGKTIVVMPDTPYFKTYRVNYVNMNRDTISSIGVSGEITSTVVGEQSGGQTGAQGGANASNARVDTKSLNNFWDVLRQNIESILAASKALSQNADQRASRAEAERAAREQRIAQAEAVSRAGANAASLFSTAFGPDSVSVGDTKNEIVINPVTGTISALGTEKQQVLIQQYLDGVTSASQRQVLIEATIAEVQLSNNFQAGVDWSRLASGTGWTLQQQLLGANLSDAPRMVIGYVNPTSDVGNISATVRLLEQFGNTRVLSSPKLMAVNNQSALLKVVDNIVYFEIATDTVSTANVSTVQTFTTTARTVPVGLVMSVLPQIGESGMVNLTVRPTISRVLRFVQDPNPTLTRDNTGAPLANPIKNEVPEIQVREMESVLQVGSGQTIILGGLMQDNVRRDRDQIPGLGNVPRVGEAFQYRDEAVSKTELVIFLKATVISNPSLQSDELKSLQRYLPSMDPTGRTP